METYHTARLTSLGATVIPYHPLNAEWPWRWSLSFLHRNHRKLLLVDDDVAYCGGMNLSKDYGGTIVGGNNYFGDVKVKVNKEHFFFSSLLFSLFFHRWKDQLLRILGMFSKIL
jgi:phosphatidylserine/phosphatidylglycerophosphate/cardiolipin synthase-like enzyme